MKGKIKMERGISIIIPHYNSINLLLRLLKSIPQKEDIQVIVVDDKSDLKEVEKLKFSEEFKKIEFYMNDRKKSAGTCRNIGLEKAKKEWIIFADADDYFSENFYNILIKELDIKKDIVYFLPYSVNSETYIEGNRHKHHEKLINAYFQNNIQDDINYKWIVPWSRAIKKKLIIDNNILFDEVIASNDVMFSLKLAAITKNIKVSNKTIYIVTFNNKSLTQTFTKEIFEARYNVLKRKNEFLKKNKKLKYVEGGYSLLKFSMKVNKKKFLEVLFYFIKNIRFVFQNKILPKIIEREK